MICGYGCGRKANYSPRNGMKKWCCESYFSKCPAVIKKQVEKNTGKKRSNSTKKKIGASRRGIKNKKPKYIIDSKNLCDFGCQKIAHYYFSVTKKWCCESNVSKCQEVKEKISSRLQGHSVSNKTKILISKKIVEINKTNEQYRLNQSLSRKLKAEDYVEKYPFFSKIEKIRNTEDNQSVEVKCKYCNKWFEPTGIQLFERIRQLEKEDGKDGCYFYCSDDCKKSCPLFNLHGDPFQKTNVQYTSEEYEIFRTFVLERDKYTCQFCGDQATNVHHERPQKLEPFFSLDPCFAWSCCKRCHYEKGHVPGTECSTGYLSNVICLK